MKFVTVGIQAGKKMQFFVRRKSFRSSFFLDRDNGIFFEMLTYPLSRSPYMLGKVLFTLLVSLVSVPKNQL